MGVKNSDNNHLL